MQRCLECDVECQTWDQLPYSRRYLCPRCRRAMLDDIAMQQAAGTFPPRMRKVAPKTLLELWDKTEAERLGVRQRKPRGAYAKVRKHG